MIQNDMDKYRSFSFDNFPFFYQPFWLDIVSENNWKINFIEEQNEIVAIMPIVQNKTKPNNLLMPILTPFLGPYLNPEFLKGKAATKNSKIHKLLNALLETLPKFDYYEQRWHPSSNMWLPFYWNGFNQTTKYTYILDIQDTDIVKSNLKSNIRTDIKKAQKTLKIRKSKSPEDIIQMMELTFKRQSIPFPYRKEVIKKLINSCCDRRNGAVYQAVDEIGNVHSATFIVWDKHKAYYLLGGSNPKYRSSGSMSFLLWNVILDLKGRVECFDFEGSSIQKVEKFFRAFGGEPTPYFEIIKTQSKAMKAKSLTKKIIKTFSNDN